MWPAHEEINLGAAEEAELPQPTELLVMEAHGVVPTLPEDVRQGADADDAGCARRLASRRRARLGWARGGTDALSPPQTPTTDHLCRASPFPSPTDHHNHILITQIGPELKKLNERSRCNKKSSDSFTFCSTLLLYIKVKEI